MKLDISHIYDELNIIINNSIDYTLEIILYAVSALDIIEILLPVVHNDNINNINDKHIIPYKFIEIMKYLTKYMDCYIDFDLITYLCETRKRIRFYLNKELVNNKQCSVQFNIYTAIEDMLIKDNKLLNTIIYRNRIENQFDDEYGIIDKNVIILSKKMFNSIDKDNNGYLTASDILQLFKISHKRILLFNNNFFNIMTDILITDKKIDYYSFLKYLF